MNPLWATLLGGVAGFIGSTVLATFLASIAMRERDPELGFIAELLAVSNFLLVVTNTLLGGILGVLLFQAMR